jgi:hypothetical protein
LMGDVASPQIISDLIPKADVCGAHGHVRFGPIADIRHGACVATINCAE